MASEVVIIHDKTLFHPYHFTKL